MDDVPIIDARGLACPQPVLRTKEFLDKGEACNFKLLVDNQAAKENVCRFAQNCGCSVHTTELPDNCYQILITRESNSRGQGNLPASQVAPAIPLTCREETILVYVGRSCMGSGDENLGRKLMRGFLRTWIDVDPLPWRMIFINSGVELTVVDEEAVDALGMLQQKGVEILSCGTCLQHFGYENDLKIGRTTNMYEVVDSLRKAAKVVSPA